MRVALHDVDVARIVVLVCIHIERGGHDDVLVGMKRQLTDKHVMRVAQQEMCVGLHVK